MLLPDVNILVYAFREDSHEHNRYKAWLQHLVDGDETYGMSDLVLSGFLRVVTNPRVFNLPAPIGEALVFVERVRSKPNCVSITPGIRHWSLFTRLCESGGVRGNLVPDAYFAALALESGSEWITTDGDFARFPGLRWRRPF